MGSNSSTPSTQDSNAVSLKELRENFYKLRDLEIQNLWQRASIFAGLIGLFFAGYGYILVEKLRGTFYLKDIFLHTLCFGIAILAIIFSVIWIKMAKGAKAWFEVQERNISEIEAEVELNIPLRYQMGKLPYPGSDNEPENCIFSTSCGAYSVSKLNIIFGQVLFWIWLCIWFLHLYILYIYLFTNERSNYLDQEQHAFWIFINNQFTNGPTPFWGILLLAVLILVWLLCLSFFGGKSGAIIDKYEYLKKYGSLLTKEVNSLSQKINSKKLDKNSEEYKDLETRLNGYVRSAQKTYKKKSLCKVIKKCFATLKKRVKNIFKCRPEYERKKFIKYLEGELGKIKVRTKDAQSLKKILDDLVLKLKGKRRKTYTPISHRLVKVTQIRIKLTKGPNPK